MSGWVKLARQFTNDELWFNVTAFRLYVWILLKAAYEDGMVINGRKLKKGQYIRAYSQLGEDLMYIEGRSRKKLAKSTIKRAVDKLVKCGLLVTEDTPYGTVFTVVNADQLKRSDGSADFFCVPFRETETERSLNEDETVAEQKIRNQEVKNIKKDERIAAIAKRFKSLRNNGSHMSPKDEAAIAKICKLPVPTERLEGLLEEIFRDYHQQNPTGTIHSAVYCEKAIRTKLEAKRRNPQQKPPRETLSERVERLIQEGKIPITEEPK